MSSSELHPCHLRAGDVVLANYNTADHAGRRLLVMEPASTTCWKLYRVTRVQFENPGVWVAWVQHLIWKHERAEWSAGPDASGPHTASALGICPRFVNGLRVFVDGVPWDQDARAVRKFANGQRVRVVGQPDAFAWVVGDEGPVTDFHAGSQSYGVNLREHGSMSIPERYLASVNALADLAEAASCPSTYESQETGELLRCPVQRGHRCAHGMVDYQWHDHAATTERPWLGDLSGKRCPAIIHDAVRQQEFRCQSDTSSHTVLGHQHFAPDGTIRRWNDKGDLETTRPPREPKPIVDAEYEELPPNKIDYFGDGAIEGKWSTFDPATPPERPLDPATQRAIRSVERKGRRIRAVMEKAKREVEHQEARYRALEVGGLPAPSSFVCACGATVAVGATHRCEMVGSRPMRSAGPLDDEHYAKKIRARIEEQERIDAWDENWDDHLPRESQRTKRA